MTPAARLPRGTAFVAVGVFVLAFVVRLVWILRVQSPLDAVYSDMGGYVDRAQTVITGQINVDPRVMSIYPPGAHYLYALEFLALGRNSRNAIAIAHALVGAIPAASMVGVTARLVPSLGAAALVGVLVALWAPQVAFDAFFLSELWFMALLTLYAWLAVRPWKHAPGKLLTGATAALAFVVRPQILMTLGIELGLRGLRLLWQKGLGGAFRGLVWLVIPLALMVGVTSVRFHRLSGHWGLIAQSAGNRLWADTDICQINSTWRSADGGVWSYWFSPPSKPAHKPSDSVHFEGFIVDPDILDAIRLERMRTFSWKQRVARKFSNVGLLFVGNLPWPESNYREPPWRLDIQEFFATALVYAVLPLAAVGLFLGRRNRVLLIAGANLFTVIFSAAFFFGEARYNIPYAPFALMLAVAGGHELGGRLLRRGRRVLRTRRAARRARTLLQAEPQAEALPS